MFKGDPIFSQEVGDKHPPALDWIKANERLIAINTAVLALIHPQQYALGMTVLRAAVKNPAGTANSPPTAWVSPMTGFVASSNVPIRSQQGVGGTPEWYDILMACGYYQGEDLFFPEINLWLRYAERTTIGLCSQMFRYQVGRVTTGNRMIFKWYMRSGVPDKLNIPHDISLPKLHNVPSHRM